MNNKVNKKRAKEICNQLLEWYNQNKRDLPWRKTKDPYAIWVCEVMAQQTRIASLIPYYYRFMERFPNIEKLANANEDEVLKSWEGLGYYARAQNLQKAAKQIMSQFQGKFPSNEKEILGLSGIGDYTCGAILSIAFEKPFPAVDGNVLRVFSRLENSREDITKLSTKQLAKKFVFDMMPDTQISSFTQALMELGALVCTPKNPLCIECPLQLSCKAYYAKTQEELPIKASKNPVKHIQKTLLIICNHKNEILMRKRNEKLLNGLWEFYMIEEKMDKKTARSKINNLGYTFDELIEVGESSHVFTHLIWHMNGYYCVVNESHALGECIFLNKENLDKITIPTAIQFYMKWVANRDGDFWHNKTDIS